MFSSQHLSSWLMSAILWKINNEEVSSAKSFTASKVSKYGVFSGLYFPVFGLDAGNYGLEKTPYLDIFTQ